MNNMLSEGNEKIKVFQEIDNELSSNIIGLIELTYEITKKLEVINNSTIVDDQLPVKADKSSIFVENMYINLNNIEVLKNRIELINMMLSELV